VKNDSAIRRVNEKKRDRMKTAAFFVDIGASSIRSKTLNFLAIDKDIRS